MEQKEEQVLIDPVKLLLEHDIPDPETKQVEVKRLSNLFGSPFVIELEQMTYSDVGFISELKENKDVQTLLKSEKNGVYKNERLWEKYKVNNPADLVKAIHTPGEIGELAYHARLLSGFSQFTVQEFKKNSETEQTEK